MSTTENSSKSAKTTSAPNFGNIWRNGNIRIDAVIRDVAFGAGTFVAVGDDGVVYTSTNGTAWTKSNTNFGKYSHLFAVTFSEGKTFIAAGRDGLIVRSTDSGKKWTVVNARSTDVHDPDIYGVAFGNNVFAAMDESGKVLRSTDGIQWKKVSGRSGDRRLTFGNGWFMGTASSGRVYRSKDGAHWAPIKVGTHIVAIHYDGYSSTWLAVGSKIFTSSNGVNWTQQLDLTSYGIKAMLYSITSTPSSIIAAGENGLMFNSEDGVTWRKGNSGSMRYFFGMAYGKNIVVGVGNGGRITGRPDKYYLFSTHYSNAGGTPPPPIGQAIGKSITVTAPKAAEKWRAGSLHDIKWTSKGGVGHVKLEYTTDSGKHWKVFDSVAKNDGKRPWIVPDTLSDKCKIKISEVDNPGVLDTNSKYFSIIEGADSASITFQNPKPGDKWEVGKVEQINWTSSGGVGHVRLEYSVDNGGTWMVFDGVAKNDGNRPWLIPDTPSKSCKIKISEVDNPSINVASATFAIAEPFQTISVAAGTNTISDAARDLKQGEVMELGIGIYVQTEPIVIPGAVTRFGIRGEGMGASIVECSDCNGILQEGADTGVLQCELSGMTFTAAKTDAKYTGINLNGNAPGDAANPNIIIRDVGFQAGDENNYWDTAIHIRNAGASLIANIHITGTPGLKGTGIKLEGTTGTTVSGGYLKQLNEALNLQNCKGVTLTGTDISGVDKGVTLGENVLNMMLSNCKIEQVKRYALYEHTTAKKGSAGYHVINGGYFGFAPDAVKYTHLIWLQNDGSVVNALIANGNGTDTNGLTLSATSGSGMAPVHRVRVTGCMFRDMVTGIYLLNGTDCILSGNICDGTTNGIFISGDSKKNILNANIGPLKDQGKDNQADGRG
ncbi:MAG: hypothetical protein GY950_30805 [bacterium]|nr:hypothetical protein [bacterium]